MIIQLSRVNFETKRDRKIGPIVSLKFRNKKIGLCFCHRLPERSLTIFGYTMPLCARCTGIVIGSIMALILAYLNIIFSTIIYLMFLIPLIIDGVTQSLKYRTSNNLLRLTTGIIFGVGYVALIINFFLFLFIVSFSFFVLFF